MECACYFAGPAINRYRVANKVVAAMLGSLSADHGQRLDHTARLWNVPPPAQDEPERLQLSVEVRTGYHTDANGIRRTLNQGKWLDRKQKLQALGGPCGVRRWEDLTPAELRQSVPTLAP